MDVIFVDNKMKDYKVGQRMFYIKKSCLYNKYTKGQTRKVNVNSELYKKLTSIVSESKVFNNIDDLLTFMVWEFNEKKGLYYYQKMKHFDEIHILYETLDEWAKRLDEQSKGRESWKRKCRNAKQQLNEVKIWLRKKKIPLPKCLKGKQ